MVAQFTVKTTNLEFDIYFLSLMSFSINRQVSHFIHMQKFDKNFMFSDLTWKKIFAPGNGGGRGGGAGGGGG